MARHAPKRNSAPRPYEVLFQMVIGKWISQAIGTVVEIGFPDNFGTARAGAATSPVKPTSRKTASIAC